MTYEELRSWLQTSVDTWRAANYPDLPVFYENAEVPNQESVGPIWLDVCLRFTGGKAMTVGTRPMGRDTGNLSLSVYHRQGEGTQLADQIRDSLREHFRTHNRVGTAALDYPIPALATPAFLGWHKTGLLIPFRSTVG